MPIIKTNQPKIGFSFLPSIFLEILIPISNPNTAMLVKINKNSFFMLVIFWELAKPNNEFIEIINIEVTIAFFI